MQRCELKYYSQTGVSQSNNIAFLACKTSYKVSHFTRHKSHLSGSEKLGRGEGGRGASVSGALEP